MGDVVHWAVWRVGGEWLMKVLETKLGFKCACAGRRARWNARWPFKKALRTLTDAQVVERQFACVNCPHFVTTDTANSACDLSGPLNGNWKLSSAKCPENRWEPPD